MRVVSYSYFNDETLYLYLDGILPKSHCAKITARIQKILGSKIPLELGYSMEKKCHDFFIPKQHLGGIDPENIEAAINICLKGVQPEQ